MMQRWVSIAFISLVAGYFFVIALGAIVFALARNGAFINPNLNVDLAILFLGLGVISFGMVFLMFILNIGITACRIAAGKMSVRAGIASIVLDGIFGYLFGRVSFRCVEELLNR
jgi:hypothetical protein